MARVAVIKDSSGKTVARITIPDGATEEQINAKIDSVLNDLRARQEKPKPRSDSPQDLFVFNMLPHAQEAAGKIGVDPRLLLAQAALETGWGQHVPKDSEGNPSNNLFGVKAGSSWPGRSGENETTEFRNGSERREKASFRAYETPAGSFNDYAELILNSPRYAEAVKNASDPEAYLKGLVKGGYATDPKYVEKVMAVYNSNALKEI